MKRRDPSWGALLVCFGLLLPCLPGCPLFLLHGDSFWEYDVRGQLLGEFGPLSGDPFSVYLKITDSEGRTNSDGNGTVDTMGFLDGQVHGGCAVGFFSPEGRDRCRLAFIVIVPADTAQAPFESLKVPIDPAMISSEPIPDHIDLSDPPRDEIDLGTIIVPGN